MYIFYWFFIQMPAHCDLQCSFLISLWKGNVFLSKCKIEGISRRENRRWKVGRKSLITILCCWGRFIYFFFRSLCRFYFIEFQIELKLFIALLWASLYWFNPLTLSQEILFCWNSEVRYCNSHAISSFISFQIIIIIMIY